MANHQLPALTSTYSNFVQEMSGRFNDLAVGVDPAVTTATNVPTNTIRWNSVSNKWQKRTATDWIDLSNNYAINISGNAATATVLATARNINGVSFNGSTDINVNLNNAVTFNNSGTGAASGAAFSGSAATTISYNTIGAPKADGTGASGTWSISITGTAGSVAWTNVTGRPTNVSSFTNDSAYITSSGRSYPRRSDGTNIDFIWSGQGGQPTWLWGGNDGVNMYVYNPSNFSVNYASSAGSVAASGITSGTISTARLGAGTANSSTYLRGDNVWATPYSPGTGFGDIGSYAMLVRVVANDLGISGVESGSNLRYGYGWSAGVSAPTYISYYVYNNRIVHNDNYSYYSGSVPYIAGGGSLNGTWRKMDSTPYYFQGAYGGGEEPFSPASSEYPISLWVRIS